MQCRRNLVGFFLVLSLLVAGQVWGAAGDPLWEQSFNYLPDYDVTEPYALAATSSTLMVCGTAFKQNTDQGSSASVGFIRFFDAVTGNPKWPGIPLLTLASTTGATNTNVFTSIILSGNTAMVQGYALSYTQNSQGPPWQTINLSKTILRAYNMNTGQLIWENIKDGYGYIYGVNSVIANNKVFMIGADNPMGLAPCPAWVQAYQIPSTSGQGMSLLLKE